LFFGGFLPRPWAFTQLRYARHTDGVILEATFDK
jgi:hypothetical protein